MSDEHGIRRSDPVGGLRGAGDDDAGDVVPVGDGDVTDDDGLPVGEVELCADVGGAVEDDRGDAAAASGIDDDDAKRHALEATGATGSDASAVEGGAHERVDDGRIAGQRVSTVDEAAASVGKVEDVAGPGEPVDGEQDGALAVALVDEDADGQHQGDATPGWYHPRYEKFMPGNEVAKRHGAYAGSTVLAKAPRVVELAAEARAAAPWLTAADEPALRLYALSVARLELASQVLLDPIGDNAGAVEEWRKKVELSPTLSRDSRGWANTAVRLAAELGLTPAGRAAIEDRLSSVVALADVERLLGVFIAKVVELGALASRVDAATVEQHMVELDDALAEIEGVEMPRSGEEAPVDAEFEPIADGGETTR